MRDKRESFVKLAEARVQKATEILRLIGNLSNRSNYAYSDDDVQAILAALEAELKLVRTKFQAALARRRTAQFKLK